MQNRIGFSFLFSNFKKKKEKTHRLSLFRFEIWERKKKNTDQNALYVSNGIVHSRTGMGMAILFLTNLRC